jgi:hypothetical protein
MTESTSRNDIQSHTKWQQLLLSEIHEVKTHMASIDTTLAKQEVNLAVQATQLSSYDRRTTELETAIKPIQKTMHYIHAAWIIAGLFVGVASAAATYWARG